MTTTPEDVPAQQPVLEVSPYANRGPQDSGGTLGYSTGPQLFDPALFAGGGGHSYVDGLTASPAAGGQAGALPMTQSINRISSSRATGDCVSLPLATGGQLVVIRNAHATNGVTVYAAYNSTDLLNNAPGTTGVVLPSRTTVMWCSTPGRWFSLMSA